MDRLDVTNELVRTLIIEVAPLVEQTTGWSLFLDGLASRVVPRERGYEEVVLTRLRGIGIDADEDEPRGFLERVTEYVVEGTLLAAYEPSTQELLVVRENVDDSNMNGLRVVLAHELTHRAQHIRHPELFDRVAALARDLVARLDAGASLQDLQPQVDAMAQPMTLLESHAHHVQNIIHHHYYPDAVIESHFDLPNILLRMFGGRKVAQYTDAMPAVAESISRGDIDALFCEG